MPSPSGVKRQMLPVTATVPGSGLMIAARVRRLRSRSLALGWPERPLAQTLSLNLGMPKIPEGRLEVGPLLAGRVLWP